MNKKISNRLLRCGMLVIATPETSKSQLNAVEQDADIMAKWDGKKIALIKNRHGPLMTQKATTITQAMKLIEKAVQPPRRRGMSNQELQIKLDNYKTWLKSHLPENFAWHS